MRLDDEFALSNDEVVRLSRLISFAATVVRFDEFAGRLLNALLPLSVGPRLLSNGCATALPEFDTLVRLLAVVESVGELAAGVLSKLTAGWPAGRMTLELDT